MGASQSGVFNVQELKDAGETLVGGRLYTYVAGTTTLKIAYTDADATIPQTYTSDGMGGQYIALNARGELPQNLYLAAGPYDLALKRADGSTVWTRRADPVADSATAAVAVLFAPAGSTLIGFKGPETDEVAKTIYLNLIEVARVSRWDVDPGQTGAVNTANLQKAINSGTRRELVFAEGDYHFHGMSTVPSASIMYLTGQGVGVSRMVQDDLAADLLLFDLNYAQGGGLYGLTLTSNVGFNARGSTGRALRIAQCNDNFLCDHFSIESYDKCISMEGGYQPHFSNFRLLAFTDYGIFLVPNTGGVSEIAGTRWSDGKISNFGFLGDQTTSIGIWLQQGSGEFFGMIDTTQVGRGLVANPPANSWTRFLKFERVQFDTSYYEGWTFDGSNGGYVLDVGMVNCWSAGSGGGAARPAGSDRGAGLLTKGPALDDIRWVGGELRDNDNEGWLHQGGSNVRIFDASISKNSRRTGFSNVYAGVRTEANCSLWGLYNCRIGNFSQGVFNNEQAESVNIGATNDGYQVLGCNLSAYGSGKLPIINASPNAPGSIISSNLPNQVQGANESRDGSLKGCTIANTGNGESGYMGPVGMRPDEPSARYLMDHPGVTALFTVKTSAAPGTGKNFAYELLKNGTPTGISFLITGSATLGASAGALVFDANDAISIQYFSDAGAAFAAHSWSINYTA